MFIITYNPDNNYKPVQKGGLHLGVFPSAQQMPALLPDWQKKGSLIKDGNFAFGFTINRGFFIGGK